MLALFQNISKQAKENPFSLAIINPNFQLSYSELHTLINHCLSLFEKHSIQAGDRIGLLFDKPINHFIASLACLYHGCTQISFHKSSSQNYLVNFSTLTRCQFLLSDKNIDNLAITIIPFSISQTTSNTHNNPLTSPFSQADNIALLIIGSGTTANNKIITVSFSALALQIQRDIFIHPIKDHDRFLALSPISYYTTLRRMLACLQVSACCVFIDMQKHDVISFCNRIRVDHLSLIAAHVQHLFMPLTRTGTPKLPYLKTLFIGASPISQSMREFLQNEITANVFIFYGPNEIGASTCAHLHNTGNIIGTIGLPVDGVQIEIIDNTNRPCAIGETGRVRLKAEGICTRYENDENHTLTNEAFKDGWFYPNDLAYIDSNGHIIFQGREDDLIIYFGHNIYPRQIEEVLEQHPHVKEAAAFGLTRNNGEQVPVAIICVNDSANLEANDLIKAIKNFCDEKLHVCSPAHIQIEKELPKNAAGKILKRELKEKYQTILFA